MIKEQFDLVILGSGAAGLAAALLASIKGDKVLLAEKSDFIGGTAAMSGGCIWIPNNHHMSEIGIEDDRDQALIYLRAVAPTGWAETEENLWQALVDNGPEMLSFIEAHTALKFKTTSDPDAYMEASGAKPLGRNVSPEAFSFKLLGEWASRVRPSSMPSLLSYHEIVASNLVAMPMRIITRFALRMLFRKLTNRRAMGQALVGGLLKACLDNGCVVRTRLRAPELNNENGRITGVNFETDDGEYHVSASKAVIIATGGFEWNQELMQRYHPGSHKWTASPDTNTGDGLELGLSMDAQTAHMDQSLIMGTRPVKYMGLDHAVPAADYTLPHTMIVNQTGRRFVNELQLNVGEAIDARNPESGERLNQPAWRILDSQFVKKYRHMLPAGEHLRKADSLRELAKMIDIDEDSLQSEADKMTRFAHAGVDEDFGRGSFGWDRGRSADPRQKPNPCLGSIEKAPFYAVPLPVSFLGTKGGLRTNEHGQVIHKNGNVIEGLYCAGNAMANPIGSKGVGAGTTLGPCLTWGYICAQHALTLPDVTENGNQADVAKNS
jgi:3-oxosteroid 1-dehydrogenase